MTSRVLTKNQAGVRADGDYVLYWMIASRRVRWNFAIDRAAEWASELGRPLLVLEALRCDYPWASDRTHRFILDGMRDNARALEQSGIGYLPYVEPARGAGKGLLEALAERAAVVVTDEFPSFFLPRMVEAAAAKLDVKLEAVDSNGLLPLQATDRAFGRAYDFRRFLQRELPHHLDEFPRRSILSGDQLPRFDGVAKAITRKWPAASPELLEGTAGLEGLPIDHEVAPIAQRGGYEAAQRALRRFVDERLERYAEERNEPGVEAASELSGYLHFGHLSAHQVLDAIARHEEWTPWKVSDSANGARSGWWNMSPASESFLDELVTWREVGYNFCFHRPDHAELESLPDWARGPWPSTRLTSALISTIWASSSAPRPTMRSGTRPRTSCASAAEIHNYLRMLWGKKILHWTRSPREALDIMIELNNRYAIDGRDPNSYSGIFWVLGRFDRAWGPEREVFGKIRYMSSKNTRRKLKVDSYVERWSGAQLSL